MWTIRVFGFLIDRESPFEALSLEQMDERAAGRSKKVGESWADRSNASYDPSFDFVI